MPQHDTRVDEIAADIFRLSTHVPQAGPDGMTFNQFLVRDDEPFLFHTGMRRLYADVSAAVARLVPLPTLRWISFAHVEADECGALNLFLAEAPAATVVHGAVACMVSIDDLADRAPCVIGDRLLEVGSHRLRYVPTPHVPHGWESALWFDEVTRTLFAGDLFTHHGDGPPLVTDDLVEPAVRAEVILNSTCHGPSHVPTLLALADLEPSTLAVMHGSSFAGDCSSQLRELAARSPRWEADVGR